MKVFNYTRGTWTICRVYAGKKIKIKAIGASKGRRVVATMRGPDKEGNAVLMIVAPLMYSALLANWKRKDAAGKTFYCNCAASGALSSDCSEDKNEFHFTGCGIGRGVIALIHSK